MTIERTPDPDGDGGGPGADPDDEGETVERLVPGDVITTSRYLPGGQYEDLQIYFDEQWSPSSDGDDNAGPGGGPGAGGGTGDTTTLFAVLHHDTDDNRQFGTADFDEPYLLNWTEDDDHVVEANATWVPVNDSAEIEFVPDPDEDEGPPDGGPETDGPQTPPPTPTSTPTPEAPGFGFVGAVVALLIGTLSAVRRAG